MYSRVRLIAGSLVLFLMSAVVLVPISNAAEATPTSVMKHDNFEEVLWTSQSGEECPISFEEIREIWRGELLRARLKDYGIQKEVVGDEEVMPTKRMRFYISCADHDVKYRLPLLFPFILSFERSSDLMDRSLATC